MIGLALEAGGIKGAAHIGVLQALEEEGIKIDFISGSSSGSIVSAMYAIGYKPIEILQLFKNYCHQITDFDRKLPFKIIGMAFTGKLKVRGLAKGNALENIIRDVCIRKCISDISQVKIPLAIPTVDICTGETIYYTSHLPIGKEILNTSYGCKIKNRGNLPSIIRASSSIPAVFEPRFLENRYLVDGAVKVACPIRILKDMGADKVLAISFFNNKACSVTPKCNMIDFTLSAFEIMSEEIKKYEMLESDFNLKIDTTDIMTLDCSKINYMANLGYSMTKKYIKEIKEALL